jgi:ABC-type Zn2+ transport system substrate-binding protein/surface adhesin
LRGKREEEGQEKKRFGGSSVECDIFLQQCMMKQKSDDKEGKKSEKRKKEKKEHTHTHTHTHKHTHTYTQVDHTNFFKWLL